MGYWQNLSIDITRAMLVAAMGILLREVTVSLESKVRGCPPDYDDEYRQGREYWETGTMIWKRFPWLIMLFTRVYLLRCKA